MEPIEILITIYFSIGWVLGLIWIHRHPNSPSIVNIAIINLCMFAWPITLFYYLKKHYSKPKIFIISTVSQLQDRGDEIERYLKKIGFRPVNPLGINESYQNIMASCEYVYVLDNYSQLEFDK